MRRGRRNFVRGQRSIVRLRWNAVHGLRKIVCLRWSIVHGQRNIVCGQPNVVRLDGASSPYNEPLIAYDIAVLYVATSFAGAQALRCGRFLRREGRSRRCAGKG